MVNCSDSKGKGLDKLRDLDLGADYAKGFVDIASGGVNVSEGGYLDSGKEKPKRSDPFRQQQLRFDTKDTCVWCISAF